MQQGLTAQIAAADADPHASRRPLRFWRDRRRAGFAAIGLGAYLLAFVAAWPAPRVIDPGDRWVVTGTAWHGEATLAGAYRVRWRWAPLRSIASLAYAADWRLEGAGADVAGEAAATPHRLLLERARGTADGALLAALVPDLPFACDALLAIDLPRLLAARDAAAAQGTIRSSSGRCTAATGGDEVALPALALTATPAGDGAALTLAPLRRPTLALMRGTLGPGRLTLAPTPAGTGLLPFLRGLNVARRW